MTLNRLYNDNCLTALDNLGQMGVSVDLVLTDPPYNISQANNFKTMKTSNGNQCFRQGIDFGEWDYNFNQIDWLTKVLPLITTNGSIVIFNSWRNMGMIADALEQNGFVVKDLLQWIKPNSAPRNRDRRYIVNYEFAIWAVRKGAKWTFNRQHDKKQDSQFYYPLVGGKEKTIHPTQKPVKLMSDLVRIHSNEGDTVLDCFMGSGTTGVACNQLNRHFIGIELDENYFNIANKRIKEAMK